MKDNSKCDFKIKDASNIFFTSDTHFNHFNIINSCNRPFKNEIEMNEIIIENWNNKVNDDSIIFHLGDFAWGGFNKWLPIREQLKGHIILIKGNHDDKNGPKRKEDEEKLFDFTTYQMKLKIENRTVYVNHYPFLCYGGIYREPKDQVWALHGHIHLGPNSFAGKDVPRMKFLLPTQYDVGVDMNNFTPISWQEIKTKIEIQVEKNVNCFDLLKNET